MRRFPRNWPTTADAVWQVPTADNWSIAIHVYGDPTAPRPAVALFHGALANSRSFDVGGYGLAPFLRDQGFNAFAIDFRGRGYSLPPRWSKGWTIDELIHYDVPAALRAIRRRAEVERVHVIGHSLGGMSLLGYLVVDGSGVDRVVTLGASARLDLPWALGQTLRVLSHISVIPLAALGERAGFLATWIPHGFWRWCCNPNNMPVTPFRRFLTCGSGDIAVKKMLHLKTICEQGRLVSADGDFDYSARLAVLTNPILVVGGTADTMVAPKHIRFTEELLKSSPSKLLWCGRDYGCAHDYGHLDLVLGKNARTEVFAKIHDFLRLGRNQTRRRLAAS